MHVSCAPQKNKIKLSWIYILCSILLRLNLVLGSMKDLETQDTYNQRPRRMYITIFNSLHRCPLMLPQETRVNGHVDKWSCSTNQHVLWPLSSDRTADFHDVREFLISL